jgi:hypothetical protein
VLNAKGASNDEEFVIPPSLILEKGDADLTAVDWFKVDAIASGNPQGFDDAAQAAFKNGLASTLSNAVPVKYMVFLMQDSGSSTSVSCAFPASLESSEAVAAALNDVDFEQTFTALVSAYSAENNVEVDISDVTSSKVIENAETTSFYSIFGVLGPDADTNLALSAVAQKPAQPASSTTTGQFDRSALIALSTGGTVCVGLIAVVAIQARSAFASKIPQPDASAAEEYRGSLTPKASDML